VQMKLRWSRWVKLFLECTVASCRHTVHLLRELRFISDRWHQLLEARRTRKHATVWRVADLLLGQPAAGRPGTAILNDCQLSDRAASEFGNRPPAIALVVPDHEYDVPVT
jgi:hypothetical protein